MAKMEEFTITDATGVRDMVSKFGSLVEELNEKNKLLNEREDQIKLLRSGEAEDIARWKEQHEAAYRELQERCEALAAELQHGSKSHTETASAMQTQLLTLRVRELESRQAEFSASPPRATSSSSPVARALHFGDDTTLEVDRLREEVAEAKYKWRTADAEAKEARERLSTEVHGVREALEEAREGERFTNQQLRAVQLEGGRTAAALRNSELELGEARLQLSRAEAELQRLRPELERLRKVDCDFRAQLKRLSLGFEDPWPVIQEATMRLRVALGQLEPLLLSVERLRLPPVQPPDLDASDVTCDTLLVEVSRVEHLQPRLEGLLQSLDAERRQQDARSAYDEEEREREVEDLTAALKECQGFLQMERKRSEALQLLTRSMAAEEEVRRMVAEAQQTVEPSSPRSMGVDFSAVVKDAEQRRRCDVEEGEEEGRVLLSALLSAWLESEPQHVAYMGIDVSDGMTLRA
eukprot:Hpha_TRINITY_DN28402_c0_g1::TRINITY_DN28402_c0_g1_i1::g.184025::m.184025